MLTRLFTNPGGGTFMETLNSLGKPPILEPPLKVVHRDRGKTLWPVNKFALLNRMFSATDGTPMKHGFRRENDD